MSKRLGIIAALSFLLGACATALPSTVDKLTIYNKSGVMLHDVSLKVPATGGLVSCKTIPPGGECSLGFRERKIQGNDIDVSWMQDEQKFCQSFSSDKIVPYTEGPLRLYIDIRDQNRITVSME